MSRDECAAAKMAGPPPPPHPDIREPRPGQIAASIEDDVVTLRSALDYPKLGYGYHYREALEALDRLAEAAHQSDRLRREVDTQTARKSEWFDEAARRGQRLSEVLDELEALRAAR